MSLMKKHPVSERRVAANRSNARKSTGPRTPEGKENSRFNGLRHGLCAQPFRRVMSELGEDPEEFDRFHAGLREASEPANELEAQLVEDLALLWWKKRRSERAQAAFQVCEVERLNLARQRARHQAERLSDDQPEEEARERGLRRAPDSRGKFQTALGSLDWLIGCLERHQGWREGNHALYDLYGQEPTARGGMILNTFWALSAADSRRQAEQASSSEPKAQQGEASGPSQGAETSQQAVEASKAATTPGPEAAEAWALRAELLNLLREERQEVGEEYALFRREHAEVSPAAADACLAPTDQRWTWILRLDSYLDRQIERKIRLLDMLQEKRRKRECSLETGQTAQPPPLTMKMQTQTHQTVENTRRQGGEEGKDDPRRGPLGPGAASQRGFKASEEEVRGEAEAAPGVGG